MPLRLLSTLAVAVALAGCETTTKGPSGMVSTETYVANALKEYGVLGGRKPDQAAINPGM